MPGLLGSIEIGKRALAVQRHGLSVTGHNLANLNTPNFARQRAEIGLGADGVSLTGVEVTEIRQIRDRALDERVRRHTQDFARSDAQSNRLRELEALFGDLAGAGITDTISAFWDAWQDLTTSPESESARITAIGRGESLAIELKRLNGELHQMHENINAEIRDNVNQINELFDSVAALNHEIVSIEADGIQQANDARDRRERQLAELSELINVRTIEEESGAVRVLIGGIAAVNGQEVAKLQMNAISASSPGVANPIADASILQIFSAGGTEAPITSGELAGLIEVRDTQLPEVITRFDQLARGIIEEVNALHRTGYGLDRTTGLDFFTGNDITSISVNPLLKSDANKLAVSGAPDAQGDNQVALAIAQLRHAKLFSDGQETAEEFNNTTISLVGAHLQRAQREADNHDLVVQQLTSMQESLSGVSIDEELSHMIQFQRAYEAAARYVTTVDQLLETLVNM